MLATRADIYPFGGKTTVIISAKDKLEEETKISSLKQSSFGSHMVFTQRMYEMTPMPLCFK